MIATATHKAYSKPLVTVRINPTTPNSVETTHTVPRNKCASALLLPSGAKTVLAFCLYYMHT